MRDDEGAERFCRGEAWGGERGEGLEEEENGRKLVVGRWKGSKGRRKYK